MANNGRTVDPAEALTGSMRDFRELYGTDLMQRVGSFYRWQDLRRQHGLWPYSKSTEEAPRGECAAKDDRGTSFRGVNFASQDYLGLSSDPEIKETAKAIIEPTERSNSPPIIRIETATARMPSWAEISRKLRMP